MNTNGEPRTRKREPLALAHRWFELRVVRFFLEVAAGNERPGQILRVLDDGGHDKPVARDRMGKAGEVFCHGRALAVGNAIRAEPPGKHVRRDDLQSAPALRPTGTDAAAEKRVLLSTPALPFSNRIPLQ